jgi:hypothetical protein
MRIGCEAPRRRAQSAQRHESHGFGGSPPPRTVIGSPLIERIGPKLRRKRECGRSGRPHDDTFRHNHRGLRALCATLPDRRRGENTVYEMADIAMAAFSTFFMQSPSFLAQQTALAHGRGTSNCQTLFAMDKIPTDNHIRSMLDPVPPRRCCRRSARRSQRWRREAGSPPSSGSAAMS